MTPHIIAPEKAQAIGLALAKAVDVDPAQIEEGSLAAEWVGGDDNVLITWRGRATLPWEVVAEIVETVS